MESFDNHRSDDYIGRAKSCVSFAIANDLKRLAECYEPEVEVLHPTSMTRNRGVFQILAQVSRFHAAFSDVRIMQNYSEACYHRTVTLWYRIGAAHTGTISIGNTNLLPSGEFVNFSYCCVLRFDHNGKISEAYGLFNRLEILRQLNVSLLDTIIPSLLKNASHTVRDMPTGSHIVGPGPKTVGQTYTSIYDPPKQLLEDADQGDVLFSLENVKKFLRHCVEDEWEAALQSWITENDRDCFVQNPFVASDNMYRSKSPRSPSGPLHKVFEQLFTSFHDCSITPFSIVCGRETKQEYEGSNMVAIHGEFRGIPPSEWVVPESSGENRIPIFPQPFHVRTSIAMYFQTCRDTGMIHAMWITMDVPTMIAQAMTQPALSLIHRSRTVLPTYSAVQMIRLAAAGTVNTETLGRYCLPSMSLQTPPPSVMFDKGLQHAMETPVTVEEGTNVELEEPTELPHMDKNYDVRSLDGIPAVSKTWSFWHKAFSRIRVRIRRVVATEDAVSVSFIVTAKHTGMMSGIEPTYRNVTMQGDTILGMKKPIESTEDVIPVDTNTIHQFMPRVKTIHTWMDLPALYSQLGSSVPVPAEKLLNGVLRHRIGSFANDYAGKQSILSVENFIEAYSADGPNLYEEYQQLHRRLEVLLTPNVLLRSPTIPVPAETDDAFIHNLPHFMRNSSYYSGFDDVTNKLFTMKAPFKNSKIVPVLTVAEGPYVHMWLTMYGESRNTEEEIGRLKELQAQGVLQLDGHYDTAMKYHGNKMESNRHFFINAHASFTVAQQGVHVSSFSLNADRISKSIQLGVEDPRFYKPGTEKKIMGLLKQYGTKNIVPAKMNVEAALLEETTAVGIE